MLPPDTRFTMVQAPRAGEIISELTLAMQEGVGLGRVARVIHPYPTQGEAVMGCGLQYIRKHWQRLPLAGAKRKAGEAE